MGIIWTKILRSLSVKTLFPHPLVVKKHFDVGRHSLSGKKGKRLPPTLQNLYLESYILEMMIGYTGKRKWRTTQHAQNSQYGFSFC